MQYPRCMDSAMADNPPYLGQADPCTSVNAENFTHMGYALRNSQWRYVEWVLWECDGGNKGDRGPNDCADAGVNRSSAAWGLPLVGRELYDHRGDDGSCFDCYEGENVVGDPGNAAVVAALHAQLRSQFDFRKGVLG